MECTNGIKYYLIEMMIFLIYVVMPLDILEYMKNSPMDPILCMNIQHRKMKNIGMSKVLSIIIRVMKGHFPLEKN